jgi:hypothetical protein
VTAPRELPPVTFYCEPCDVAKDARWNEPPTCKCGREMKALRNEPPPLFHPKNRDPNPEAGR